MKNLNPVTYFFTFLFALLLVLPCHARANHPEFEIPKGLEGRVDFWIDIFAKYDKTKAVYHHRDYPQARYSVLDLTPLYQKFSDPSVALNRAVQAAKELHEKEIVAIIAAFARGDRPGNSLEKQIYAAFDQVPGRDLRKKFRDAATVKQVRSQTGIKQKYEKAVIRSGRYMPIIERIFVQDAGLPIELTRLPFVESSFDYTAYSSVGAAGIWQFMPATARSYMKVGSAVDERRDVITASTSAAKYLKNARKTLGTWPLAVTSYNHGVAGVGRKVKQLGSKDIVRMVEHPTNQLLGFASNNFYPELLAANKIYKNLDYYFPGVQREPALNVATYIMPYAASVNHIVGRLKIDQATLKRYNYALSKGVWAGQYRVPKGYKLRLPGNYRSKAIVLNAPEPTSGSSSIIYGSGTYRVRSGDTLASIARKYSMTIKNLKALNGLRSDRIYVGRKLKVSGSPAAVSSKPTYRSVSRAPAARTYIVKRGDSLGKIAQSYGMGISTLKSLNGLRSNTIRVGQTLKVQGTAKPVAPAYQYHTVKRGENLWLISKRYRITLQKLKGLNNLKSSNVKIGQKLRVK